MVQDLKQLDIHKSRLFMKCSIRSKIIFCFLLVSIVPICIIGSISYFSSRATITRETSQYSIALLTQTAANIQLKLAEFENISVRLFINKEFNNTLANYTKSKDSMSNIPKGVIEEYFNEYMISNRDIFAFMFICDSNKERSIIITRDYYQDFNYLQRHFKETASYQSILRAGGGIVWTNTVKLKSNHFIILGRYIKDLTSGDPLGVLAIVVDEDKIDQLANLTLYNKLNIYMNNNENFSFIINDDGEIVSSPYKEEIGRNISLIMRDKESLKSILGDSVSDRDYGSEINQGSLITEVNHKQTLVTYKSIGSKIGIGGKSGWHLLSIAPTSILYKEVFAAGCSTLLLAVVFGVLAIIISLYVTNFIYLKNSNGTNE